MCDAVYSVPVSPCKLVKVLRRLEAKTGLLSRLTVENRENTKSTDFTENTINTENTENTENSENTENKEKSRMRETPTLLTCVDNRLFVAPKWYFRGVGVGWGGMTNDRPGSDHVI